MSGGPDSASSWVIAGACCFINMMMIGMARLSGMLFVASVTRFHVNREQASFPYTFTNFIRNTSGPLVGYLGEKFGVRPVTTFGCLLAAIGVGASFLAEDISTVTIFWGIIFGIGYGLGSILIPVKINQYFDKQRAMASGISFSGACLGSFILPLVVEELLNLYGLSGTFLILSGLLLNCVPVALLLRKPNFTFNKPPSSPKPLRTNSESQVMLKKGKLFSVENDNNTNRTQSVKSTDGVVVPFTSLSNKERIKLLSTDSEESREKNGSVLHPPPKKSNTFGVIFDPLFILLAVTNAIYYFTFVFMFTVIVDFARDLNISRSNEKYILMSLSVGDFLGRIGLGWVTDKGYMTRTAFAAACFLSQGVTIAAIAWSTGFVMLVTILFLYGLSEAGLVVIYPLILAEYIDEDKQTVAISSRNFLAGPLCLTIAPLIGFFRDKVGSYELIFLGMGGISIFCCLSFLLTPLITRNRKPAK